MDSVVRNTSPNVYSLIDFNILSYGEVLSFITPELKIILRKLEKLLKKKESLIIGAKFIKTCLKEGLLPKFTEININVLLRPGFNPRPMARSTISRL